MTMFFLLLSTSASAVTYYVKAGGNNGLSGTSWTNAYATLARAMQNTDATIIYMGAGNYPTMYSSIDIVSTGDLLVQGGYPSNPSDATFNAANDYAPLVNLTSFTTDSSLISPFFATTNNTNEFKGLVIQANSPFLFDFNTRGNLRLTDMTISSSDSSSSTLAVRMGDRSTNTPNLTVTNSLFKLMAAPIYVKSTGLGNVTVNGSTFTQLGTSGYGHSAIEVYGISSLSVNNSAFCSTDARNTYNGNSMGGALDIKNVTNSSVSNSSFYDLHALTAYSGGAIYFQNGTLNVSNNKFKSNVGAPAGVATVESSGATFTNNIMDNNSGNATNRIYNFSGTYPYTETGTTTSTPNPACPTSIVFTCTAGTAQVPVTSSLSIPCGSSTVNLATATSATPPGVSSLVWYTTANRSTAVLTPAQAAAAGVGTYYAFYFDSVANCYNTANSTAAVTVSNPTCGYVYLHHQATNEESSPNFTFNVAGGLMSQNYTLNDQTDFLSSEDLGASQSGRLWALARPISDATFNNFKIYYRDVNSATWVAINTPAGSPRAIDGGNGSTAIYSSNAASGAGRVYSIAADGTTTDITGDLPSGIVYDVSDNWLPLGSGGRQYASVQGRNIYQRTTATLPAVWTVIANTPSHRVDAVPKTNNLYYVTGNSTTAGSTMFYRDVTAASSISLGTPSNTDDMAINEDGTVMAGFKRMGGTPSSPTWTTEDGGMYGYNLTGGPGSHFWSSVGITNIQNGNTSVRPNRIISRTAAGNWIDDERIRATGTHNDNSVLLSLSPGTYTITENTEPTGWRLQSIFTDPTTTTDIAAKTATVNVTANGITHLVYSNVNDVATAMPTDCVTGFTENFGTTANFASPTISSSLHNGSSTLNGSGAVAMGYGYYGLITNTNLIGGDITDGNGVIYTTGFTDHTTGSGRMMAVNSTGQSRLFYQKRITGLTVGVAYNYSVWVRSADINASTRPDISLQVLHPTTGAVLFSTPSAPIANANPPAAWKQIVLNFTATQTSVDLALVNLGLGAWGGDFAVDDVALVPVKPTAPIVDTTTQPTCAVPTGSVALSGLPSSGTWTVTDTNGGATITGTGTTATFSNLAMGNHTFTVTLGTCVSNASANVVINAAPAGSGTLGPISGSSCVLPPASYVYSVPVVSGATSYTWSYSENFVSGAGFTAGQGTNSITINFLEGTPSGTLSVTATTSCGTSSASTLAITVMPKPSIATLGESTICPGGGSVILTSTPAAAYQWYKDGTILTGETNQNYTATATGAYTVITSSGSCVSVESAAFNVVQQDTTPPVFVSPLGTTTKNVKIDFRNVSTATANLPQIYQNIETGALVNERVKISQSAGSGTIQGATAAGYPSTADANGPAAYGNTKLLLIKNLFDPIRSYTFNFDQSVFNLKFSLYDIDGVAKFEARAYNNGALQPITITSLKSAGPNTTVNASPSTTPTITGVTAAYSIGNINGMRTAGVNVDVPNPINSFVLASTTRYNGDTDFYVSQISYDYTAPILPADVTVTCDNIPVPVVLTATDNCSGTATVTYSQSPAAYTPSATPVTLVRTWTATDGAGNVSTYTQNITVTPVAIPIAAANQNICATNYSTLANIIITGSNIKWYADMTTTIALPSTTVLTDGATYYATQTISTGCESIRVPISIILRNCSWINPRLRSKSQK
ncbi:hypothetical protein GCM10023210_09520 [Chryseobacterium ginsengisoli]|uniref:PKD-like domain-containing protein n=2 Tax=Chryseobacterium ginsengisoli TaxID=363853 RepID=A0ABP9LWX7_9FLAO